MTTPAVKPSAVVQFPSLSTARTNLFPNPSAVSTTGFPVTSGQATLSHTGGVVRFTFTTTGAIGINVTAPAAVVTGTTYRLLIRARANRNVGVRARIRGTETPTNYATLTTEWRWIDYTGVAGAGATTSTGLVVRGATHAVSDWIEIDRVLIATAPDAGPWFAGSSATGIADGAQYTHAWLGGANASASTQTVWPSPAIATGEASLNGGRIPYGTADLEVPIVTGGVAPGAVTPALVEVIDPRLDLRATVILGDVLTGAQRSLDLSLRARTVDHKSKVLTLRLATDEAILQAWRLLVDDATPRAFEVSLRTLVGYVLGCAIAGATLEAGDADADVTARWAVTNLIPNPSIEVASTGWLAGTGASALTRTSATALEGAWSLRWTAAAGDSNVVPVPTSGTFYTVRAGEKYVFAASTASGVSRTARMAIQWWTQGGSTPVTTSWGETYLSHGAAFTRGYVIATVPEGCDRALPYVNTSGNESGNVHYVDAAMFYQGDELVPYFDGSTPDDADYDYDWASASAHAAPSTRTPIVERHPRMFIWRAGVSAWDFLTPLMTAAGIKLWCDERRRWWLVDPAAHEVPGRIALTADRASEGTDAIDLDADVYAAGVVARYENGQLDVAGAAGQSVFVRDYDGPKPGPGAAAAILARRSQLGRVQEVTALTDVTATPGMQASVSLPGTFDQLGTLAAVSWNLQAGTMRAETSELTGLIPGSIDTLDMTINDLVGTVDDL